MGTLVNRDFLIINGVRMPIPAPGLTVDTAQGVNAGRNSNNEVVGDLVGRRQYKLNNLAWHGLSEEECKTIMDAIEPFYVKVTYRDITGVTRTHTMYPGDSSGKPNRLVNMSYNFMEDLHFNLVDAGWDDMVETRS